MITSFATIEVRDMICECPDWTGLIIILGCLALGFAILSVYWRLKYIKIRKWK